MRWAFYRDCLGASGPGWLPPRRYHNNTFLWKIRCLNVTYCGFHISFLSLNVIILMTCAGRADSGSFSFPVSGAMPADKTYQNGSFLTPFMLKGWYWGPKHLHIKRIPFHSGQFFSFWRRTRWRRVAVISAKNHKRQRRKRQSVTAKREKSQTPKVLTAILTLPNLT